MFPGICPAGDAEAEAEAGVGVVLPVVVLVFVSLVVLQAAPERAARRSKRVPTK